MPVPQGVRIRDGADSDVPALEQIARSSFDRVYAFFAIRGRRRAMPFLIAEEDGAIAGFLEGRLFDGRPPIGYVYFVAVDPERRRRGAGRLLVEEALRRFEGAGATRVFAAVPGDNGASLALFRSLGFRETPSGEMRRWYGWRGWTVTVRMLVAPHEVLLAHTFMDPSPAWSHEASPP